MTEPSTMTLKGGHFDGRTFQAYGAETFTISHHLPFVAECNCIVRAVYGRTGPHEAEWIRDEWPGDHV